MTLENLKNYTLVKFHQQQILLSHQTTKKLYRLYDSKFNTCVFQKTREIYHPILEKAKLTDSNAGLLYPKQLSNMKRQMQKKYKWSTNSYSNNKFQEEQLINTFVPIFDCLLYLHREGVTHSGLCLQNIVVDQYGEIRLRDYRNPQQSNAYYWQKTETTKDLTKTVAQKELDKQNDLQAFGLILLECSSFKSIKQIRQRTKIQDIFKPIVEHYSKGFILGIYILVNKIRKFYPQVKELLNGSLVINDQTKQNHEKSVKFNKSFFFTFSNQLQSSKELKTLRNVIEELRQLYQKLKPQTDRGQRKTVITPPILTYSQQQMEDLMSKKIGVIKVSKNSKLGEDTQNKKMTHVEAIIRNDKLKMTERNNQLVNENGSGNRKNNDALKKMSNKKANHNTTAHFHETNEYMKRIRDNKQFKQFKDLKEEMMRNQLAKRLRTVSRKKNY